jgi:hypothetical protein
MATPPSCILVMRHAEKTADPQDPHLSAAGAARAEALATYIPKTFGPPHFIFATAISKHSARPYETVQPLSKGTGVPINATIADQDYSFLASELLSHPEYSGKQILVCWHHGNIPSLLHALKAAPSAYPDPWDPKVFNLVLNVTFASGAQPTVTEVEEPF